MVDVSPCNGVCRMETYNKEVRCKSCFRTYDDLAEWMTLSHEGRLERMKQLKREKQQYNGQK